jgi:hypothetical protein
MHDTKLLVIVITTASIIAAATITTSIGAARPAFAKVNCTSTSTIVTCSGGSSLGDIPGGRGEHRTMDFSSGEITTSGGIGGNSGTFVGGAGGHTTCNPSGCTFVGGTGIHPK